MPTELEAPDGGVPTEGQASDGGAMPTERQPPDGGAMATERQAPDGAAPTDTGKAHEGPEALHEEPPVDPEVEARRVAVLSLVRKFGDPILKSRATAVDRFDDALRAQIGRMASLMSDALGVGLAAPQLGVSQRLVVYRVGPDAPVVALANPVVEWASDERETMEEGCLSIPGIAVDVERPVYVRVRAQDDHGDRRLVEASGLEARVIQHEIDHLEGVLIVDRAPRDQRREAIRTLREGERAQAA